MLLSEFIVLNVYCVAERVYCVAKRVYCLAERS